MSRNVKFGTLLLSSLVVLGGLGALVGPQRAPATPSVTPAAREAAYETIRETVAKAEAAGVLRRVDARLNRADVNPLAWQALDAEGKENLARVLALYCEAQGDVARITLYDAQSASELGGYSAGRFYVK